MTDDLDDIPDDDDSEDEPEFSEELAKNYPEGGLSDTALAAAGLIQQAVLSPNNRFKGYKHLVRGAVEICMISMKELYGIRINNRGNIEFTSPSVNLQPDEVAWHRWIVKSMIEKVLPGLVAEQVKKTSNEPPEGGQTWRALLNGFNAEVDEGMKRLQPSTATALYTSVMNRQKKEKKPDEEAPEADAATATDD